MNYLKYTFYTLFLFTFMSCSDITSVLNIEEEILSENSTNAVAKCSGNSFSKYETYDVELPSGLEVGPSLKALGFDLKKNPVCEGTCTDKEKECVFQSLATNGTSNVTAKKNDDGTYSFEYKKPKKMGDKVKVNFTTKCQCVKKKDDDEEEEALFEY